MFGLDERTVNEIQSVFRLNIKVKEVFIFGSRAKGNFSSGSDIDLAVKGVDLDDDDLIDLRLAIEDIGMLYKVDLVLYNEIRNTPLGDHIDRVGVLFYNI